MRGLRSLIGRSDMFNRITGHRTTNPNSSLRMKATGILFTAITATVAILGPGSATASAAVGPQYLGANCGYVSQHVALNSPYYWKISRTNLPWVTGLSSAPHRVSLNVQFMHRSGVAYRSSWYYADAVAGKWTTSWTSSSAGTSGWTWTQDANGESGYMGAEFVSEDTFVLLSMYWFNDTTITNQVAEWAYAPNSFNNHNVCNGGAPIQ